MMDAIKQKGRITVPNWNRNGLPKVFKELGYKKGAEVGVYLGGYSQLFCDEGFEFYAIDPWEGFWGQGRSQKLQERQDEIFKYATKKLSVYPNCKIIRKSSADALGDFKDKSLDFVYIDGNHCFGHVAFDIYYWAQKVRPGGAVAGHDYWNTPPIANNVVCGVKSALDGYLDFMGIKDVIFFGKVDEPKHKNDKYYSWMFFK